ncbi:hypothetical protein [Porphyrobacter sp. TH134]|uniref:hypothetical protein n=1 Tax=Porphyrobacter sp. TH134 TaxID=2067450 RepID=UPI00117EDDCD|nr:hypothetical protein [Porphyrobacter sp. TH134]
MNTTRSRYDYLLLCGLLIFFHICDMLSTDFIIHYGNGLAVEANPVAAEAQSGSGKKIILIRSVTIAAVLIGLFFSRINADTLEVIKKYSSSQIMFGKISGISNVIQWKLIIFCSIAVISISRLIASISNISGEFLRISIPIFLDKALNLEKLSQIYLGSVVISASLGLIILVVAWEFFRRG